MFFVPVVSVSFRSGEPGVSRCCWPTISSKVLDASARPGGTRRGSTGGRRGRRHHHGPRRTNLARLYSSDCNRLMISATTLGAMRAVIQVVSSASVTVEERAVGEISGPGLLILLGVT